MANTARKTTSNETASDKPLGGQPETGTAEKIVNLWEVNENSLSSKVAAKMTETSKVRQALEMVRQLANEGDDKSEEAEREADKASLRLYKGRIDGLYTAEEVGGILGDIFGYKPKTDGTPGKTPAGMGEHIRKRIVRAVNAAAAVTDNATFVDKPDRFFETVSPDDIAPIVEALNRKVDALDLPEDEQPPEQSTVTLWTAYNKFADVKREATERVDAAFDPRKIAAIVGSLSQEGAANKVRNNSALFESYKALWDSLKIIGSVPAEEVE